MAKLAIKIRPDVAFAASGRIFLYVGTQQMLRKYSVKVVLCA